ncbi:CAF17-like 4Fe-4S cluster assembly/insertion protein YgfZ [Acidisoma silvae]|uniref:Folate-binding protein YgfZ n=1 Tax=Acidisoma silvae TaxID=2802396 RepID=A0A964DZT9_9PROT|nr:folate-binding protein [Acidisoma silvae]MCB8876646.1 folate-binding protein YgfZ [Acidisoma silvae]
MTRIATLDHRAVIAVTGEDRVSFLQGLVSQDVALAEPGRALWSALLTPQGKWLAEFFIIADGDRLLLDVEADQREDLIKRLSRFRLRAKVAVTADDYVVQAAWEGAAPDVADGLVAADARLPEAGFRILSRAGLPVTATLAEWDAHRLALGLPDGARDLEREKTVLLEAGFDELGGISWTKGCYMGQELTARTRYRGLLKRRLVPVAIEGAAPAPGTIILTAEGRDVGTMRSSAGALGLAVLRLDVLDGAETLLAGDARLVPRVPAWLKMPEPGARP